MQSFIILTVCVIAITAIEYPLPEDPFNIDNLHLYPEEMLARVDCFLGVGPCTDLTAKYKEYVPLIISRDCEDCSNYIKHYHHVFVRNLKEMMPDKYNAYKQKYDPTGEHFKRMEDADKILLS